MAGLLAAHAGALAGRIVIDTTNNFASLQGAGEMSAIGHLPPGVAGFRAFNSVGWENMAEPVVDGVVADMFFAGPDGPERDVVAGLIGDVGFRPAYVGAGPDALAAVDSLTGLWFALARGRGHGRHLGFRVLTESGSV
jgi:predicted dinucleotide-binding enzyme